jgi:hypothetical protein
MSTRKEFPIEINLAINELTRKYRLSPVTTEAGWFLRLVSKFIRLDTILKLLEYKTR